MEKGLLKWGDLQGSQALCGFQRQLCYDWPKFLHPVDVRKGACTSVILNQIYFILNNPHSKNVKLHFWGVSVITFLI